MMVKIFFVLSVLFAVGCVTRQSTLPKKMSTAVFRCVDSNELADSRQIKELNLAISKVYEEFFSLDELEELYGFYSREDVCTLLHRMQKSTDSELMLKFEELVRSNLRRTTTDKIRSKAFRDRISEVIIVVEADNRCMFHGVSAAA